jgi:TolA-binding protein
MDRERAGDTEEDSTPLSKSDLVYAKLKLFASYAMLAFAPVVSVVALVVAVISVTNNQSQSDRAQLIELTSKIDSLNASLSETKGELDNLKFAMSREKSMHGEERKKVDDRDTKIIQNVSHLQAKLKVSPTLEDQLREVPSIPAAAPIVTGAVSAPVAAAPVLPVTTDKKPSVEIPAPKVNDKTPAQAKALKDAIEKFNKK